MPSTRLRLDPRDLRGAAARVRAEFGAGARIVSAEEIRVGGIAGFFAKRQYELLIEHEDPRVDLGPLEAARPRPAGIAALLEEAERLESVMPAAVGAGAPSMSTQSDGFSAVLGSLTASVGVDALVEPPAPPAFRVAPGALLAVVGLRDDPLRVAVEVRSGIPGARVAVMGELDAGLPRIDDRRGAIALRAEGVEAGSVAIVAIGLGHGGPLAEANARRVALLGADAVWVAVDATRKPDDTARWVDAVRGAVPVREMAVLDAACTESPESVRDLGLRQAWPQAPGQ